MTPARWRQVEEIFATALELQGDSRSEYLRAACGRDAEVMREVESLLRAMRDGSRDVLESPAIELQGLRPGAAGLEAGRRLGPYEIIEPLGAGGMGAVYRARDSKLDRDVALKVMSAAVGKDAGAGARFEREAKAVAALSHPNIVAIFDFGVDDGIPYAATELLEGETLRDRLRHGRIPESEAIDNALQILRGLSIAHEKGVVHRDLKPENVFVTRSGQVKILDFGLSKQLSEVEAIEEPTPLCDSGESGDSGGSGQTQPGAVMGTVGYMSPEQAIGLPVDARSDLFSFGAILQEMLTGERAFVPRSPEETLGAIVSGAACELGGVRPSVAAVVRRCLEKSPERRFGSAREIAGALIEASEPLRGGARTRWRLTAAAAGIVLLGLLVVLQIRGRTRPAPASAAPPRVAVLPFTAEGGEGRESAGDRIASQVSDGLASLSGIQVISYRASSLFRTPSKPPEEIARSLGVQFLVDGQVRRRGGPGGESLVEVRAELVEVGIGGPPHVRWEQSFAAPMGDLVSLRSSISTGAAAALGLPVSPEAAKRLGELPAVLPAAYELFLQGEEINRRAGANDRAELERGLELFERAVALDPAFAEAWTRVAFFAAELYRLNVSPEDMRERAEAALANAERLAPNTAAVFVARSLLVQLIGRDSARALQISNEGLRRFPAYALLLNQSANLEMTLGRVDDAIGHYRQGRVLDPLFGWGLGEALTFERRYGEALRTLEQVRVFYPLNLQLIQDEANIFLAQGDLAGARAVLHRVPAGVSPTAFAVFMANEPIEWDITWALDGAQRKLLLESRPQDFGGDRGQWELCRAVASWLGGDIRAARTRADAARSDLEAEVRAQPDNHRTHAALGLALAYLGRKDEALREGQRATLIMPPDRSEGAVALSNLVQIEVLVGEKEKALDDLERVLTLSPLWSPGWLRIDPLFEPLRGNPRFQRLAASS